MLILCVSDIHGNLDALRAVLATAEKRAFHKLIVAGDIVFPGPAPLETWRRLTAAGAVMVQGVSDKALATLDPNALHPRSEHERVMIERMKAVRTELGELILERIRRLPTHVRIPLEDGGELVLVHGSPADPAEALTFDMSDDELDAQIGDDPADVIVCGMSHTPFHKVLDEIQIINVGSIGEAPDGLTEAASASATAGGARPIVAHATWIESTPQGINVEQISVPLDAPSDRLLLAR
jgi:putative phosphoesterase